MTKITKIGKEQCKEHGCAVAFHIGHSWYNKKQLQESVKSENHDCCGGTIKLSYCPFCGRKIDN